MMYYMDRVLSQQPLGTTTDDDGDATSSDFLLLSVAAFYLAMKLVGGGPHGNSSSFDGNAWGGPSADRPHQHPRQLPMSVILELSKHRFTSCQISAAEFGILQALSWRVHPPTPDQYVFDLVDLCCGNGCSAAAAATREDVFDCTIYLIELSVVNHYFLDFKPSEIVVAAMHNARNMTMRSTKSSGEEHGAGGDDKNDDDDDCVILPARTPAVFAVEPMHVLPGIDPLRVAWCRFRLSEMIEQQQARKQQTQQHAATNHSSVPAAPSKQEGASGLRTCSPVSVHPRDPANAAHAEPDLPDGTAEGLVKPSGETDGEVRHAWS
jgi:Cyclin, C-terminal domain